MRPKLRRLLDEHLDRFRLTNLRENGDLDPRRAFGDVDDVWLEVGFGDGGHLVRLAAEHPGVGLIGVEPFIEGVAKAVRAIVDGDLGNVRLYDDAAELLLDSLAPDTLSRVFVLFPDPWPKTRHHRRRFVRPENLHRLARVMRCGAELRIATDHAEFARWILWHVTQHPAFEWRAERSLDWTVRPGDWPATRYEGKALAAGRKCVYFRFRRRDRAARAGRR